MNHERVRQNYATEFKTDAVNPVIERRYSCAKAGRPLGVNPNNITRWVRQHRDRQEADAQGF